MNLNLLMLVMACLLVVTYLAVAKMRRLPGATKQIKSKEDANLLLIEYVPAKMRKLEIGGFDASAEVRAELVKAGKILLGKLPTDIRDCLNCPVSGNLTALLLQDEDRSYLTPELVIAAVGVAEASLALWKLMFESGLVVYQIPRPVIFNEGTGDLTVGKEIFRDCHIIKRISRGTGASEAVAAAMWESIVEILREGQVSVPGIRAVKPSALKLLQGGGR